MHFVELQDCLQEQNPDCDLPEYNGQKHNIQSLKLDFLYSITPLSPQHADNNEVPGDDGDDSGINSFLPFNLDFLDLSSLDLKEKLLENIPFPLFLCEEYDHISALIKKEPQNSQGSVIVSGQPGTGEVLASLPGRI